MFQMVKILAKPLIIWNVSKGNNFSSMFYGCSSLSDIKPLKNWNVSNGKNFYRMFAGCSSLSDITTLKNWKFFKFMVDTDKYH